MLRNARELKILVDKISLLDIGYGWVPLAIPFVIFEKSKNASEGDRGSYLGIDIREDAINCSV